MSVYNRLDLLTQKPPLAGTPYESFSLSQIDKRGQEIHHRINKLQNQRDLFAFSFSAKTLPGWEKVYTVHEGVVKSLDPNLILNEFGTRIIKDSRSFFTSTKNAEVALRTANEVLNTKTKKFDFEIKDLEQQLTQLADHARYLEHQGQTLPKPEENQLPQKKECSCLIATFHFLLKAISLPFQLLISLFSNLRNFFK